MSESERAVLLRVEPTVVRRGDFTLRVAPFAVTGGDVVVLWGANGSGKSTLLDLLAGRVPCDPADALQMTGGGILEMGYHWSTAVALVRHDLRGLDDLTLGQHLDLAEGVFPAFNRARAAELCERLAVPTERAFGKLSAGEQFKACLVVCESRSPVVLLMDEPFAHLDEESRIRTEALMREVACTGHRAVVIATHLLGSLGDAITAVIDVGDGVTSLRPQPPAPFL